MTTMKAWRKRMTWKQTQAAEALGVTLATYQRWEREAAWDTGKPVTPPRTALLAAAALEAGLEPIDERDAA